MASLRKRGKVWYYQFIDGDGIKRERPSSQTGGRLRKWPARRRRKRPE